MITGDKYPDPGNLFAILVTHCVVREIVGEQASAKELPAEQIDRIVVEQILNYAANTTERSEEGGR